MLRITLLLCCFAVLRLSAQGTINHSLHPVKVNYKWGFMDSLGNLRIPAIYDNVDNFIHTGLSIVRKADQLGIIDTSGQIIIPCHYELIQILDKDLFLVRNHHQWEIRNRKDQLVLNKTSGHVEILEEGYLTYETVSGIGLSHINRGKIVDPLYQSFLLTSIHNTLIVENFNHQLGLIDSLGNFLLPLTYDEIRCFEHCILAKKDRKWGLWSNTAKNILSTKWDNFRFIDDALLELTHKGHKYLYSIPLQKIILEKYATVEILADNQLLFAKEIGFMGLINRNGDILMANKYNDIQPFSKKLYRIQSAETQQWGLSTLQDTIVTVPEFDYIGILNNTVAIVKKNGKSGIINYKGELIMKAIYPDLPLSNNTIKVKDTENGLRIFIFNEAGQLEEQTVYKDFKSLKVSTRNRVSDLFKEKAKKEQIIPNQQRELNDSLVWMRARNGRFGVYNLNIKKFIGAPEYASFINYPELNISIVELSKYEISGSIPMNYVTVSVNSKFGIISNKIGKPITKTEFIDIKISDIIRDRLPVARVVFIGGKHGLIDPKGRVLLRGMAFIDKFEEGKARCSKKGALAIDVTNKHPRNLGLAIPYLNEILASYSIENVSTDTELPKGVLYIDYPKWGFIDTLGQWVVSPSYDFVEPYSGGSAIVNKDKKWGLIDANGDILLPVEYDGMNYIPDSDKNLLYITKNQLRFGCIDVNAKVIVPVEYDRVGQFKEGIIAVRRGNLWGFFNDQGKEAIACQYRQVHDFQEGLAAARHKGRWGFIDKNGNTVLQFQYARVGNFKEGVAWVQGHGNNIQYIKPSGEVILEGKYSMANDFEKGIARVRVGIKGWGLIDRSGNFILKPKRRYKSISAFNEHNLAIVKIGTKYGLVNKAGKIITKSKFAQIEDFQGGYSIVRRHRYGKSMLFKNVKYAIMDSSGSLVTRPIFRQLRSFNNGRAAFCGETGWGFINSAGEVISSTEYIKVSDFKAGRAVVYLKHNETGLIDTSGQYIVAPKIDKILEISEELALVKANYGSYYFLHEDLQRHTPNNFEAAHCFNNGAAPVRTSGRWGVINHQGLEMMTPRYSEIDAFEAGVARVKLYSSKGVVNLQGKIIIPPTYEYINYAGDGLFRIEQGDRMGYLNRYGNWVWKMQK